MLYKNFEIQTSEPYLVECIDVFGYVNRFDGNDSTRELLYSFWGLAAEEEVDEINVSDIYYYGVLKVRDTIVHYATAIASDGVVDVIIDQLHVTSDVVKAYIDHIAKLSSINN